MKTRIEKAVYQPQEVEITGITLLSREEAEALPVEMRTKGNRWWLRSPYKRHGDGAGFVGLRGILNYSGVVIEYVGVSPALILNPESSNLVPGDRFRLWGYNWTMITEDKALCDKWIAERRFDAKSNDWEKSELKAWLEDWLMERMEDSDDSETA